MYIHIQGDKQNPMVLFLQDDGSSESMWKNHFCALQNYFCVAPDLPGFRKSNKTKWTTLDEVTVSIKDLIAQSPHRKARGRYYPLDKNCFRHNFKNTCIPAVFFEHIF